MCRNLPGYGDWQTWGGREPYPEEKEPYHYCNHCGDDMNDTDGEFGEWCSFDCWHNDNKNGVKQEILRALSTTKIQTVDAVLNTMFFDLYQYTTDSTFNRFSYIIENRLKSHIV